MPSTPWLRRKRPPRSCGGIRPARQDAATNMKITAQDLLRLGIIDGIIPEPIGGAHRDGIEVVRAAGETIVQALTAYDDLAPGRNPQGKARKISVHGPGRLRAASAQKSAIFLVLLLAKQAYNAGQIGGSRGARRRKQRANFDLTSQRRSWPRCARGTAYASFKFCHGRSCGVRGGCWPPRWAAAASSRRLISSRCRRRRARCSPRRA